MRELVDLQLLGFELMVARVQSSIAFSKLCEERRRQVARCSASI